MAAEDNQPGDVNWEWVARAETHPMRISILEILAMDGGRTLAPNEMSRELRTSLAHVNYHVTELCKGSLIRLAHQHQVRGAIEHFYCLASHSTDDLFRRLEPPPEAT